MSNEFLGDLLDIMTSSIRQPETGSVVISKINAWAFRQPIKHPVSTSFGTMYDRPAVFVRLEDSDGCFGWGEIFANWPASGAEHRVNLLKQDISELVLGLELRQPEELFHFLENKTSIRALQSGEWGPFRQVIAGLDTAVWDMFSRRAGKPLREYINPAALDWVPAYASGIHICDAVSMIENARNIGFNTFKLKIGFDLEADCDKLGHRVAALFPNEYICADSNQAWNLDSALEFMNRAADFDLLWLEEPMRSDANDSDWLQLAACSTIPLAGGENIAGFGAFEVAIGNGALSILQPDVAKWGGITGCYRVAKSAINAGRRYCPHFLGGGIGLAASSELLAAVGGDGILEVDVNENMLRDSFQPLNATVMNGKWHLSNKPGLGIEELPDSISDLITHSY